MMSVKASLLLLYLRISPCTVFRRCVCFLLVLFAVDALAWSVLGSFQCLPIDHSWKWTKPGHCMNREFLYKAQGLWSLTEDIIIIILPIPTILRLQMHWRRRVLLILVFAVGLVYVLPFYFPTIPCPDCLLFDRGLQADHSRPCGAVIARIVPTAPPSVFNSDYTWWLVSMQNWIAVEYGTGMVCASLILLKPLFQLLASTRRSAAAAWPGQPKRSDSGGRARLPMSQDVTSSTVRAPRGADLMPRKDQLEIRGIHIQDCASIPKESPTPLSYLEGLRSPDLESCVSEDPFSTLPSQPRHSGTVDPQQRYELHDIHAG